MNSKKFGSYTLTEKIFISLIIFFIFLIAIFSTATLYPDKKILLISVIAITASGFFAFVLLLGLYLYFKGRNEAVLNHSKRKALDDFIANQHY